MLGIPSDTRQPGRKTRTAQKLLISRELRIPLPLPLSSRPSSALGAILQTQKNWPVPIAAARYVEVAAFGFHGVITETSPEYNTQIEVLKLIVIVGIRSVYDLPDVAIDANTPLAFWLFDQNALGLLARVYLREVEDYFVFPGNSSRRRGRADRRRRGIPAGAREAERDKSGQKKCGVSLSTSRS